MAQNTIVARALPRYTRADFAALRAWLRARFPVVTDADDLVQEAYARLMQAHATGPIACPRAFLFVTARNLALNHLRHQRIERPSQMTQSRFVERFGSIFEHSPWIAERAFDLELGRARRGAAGLQHVDDGTAGEVESAAVGDGDGVRRRRQRFVLPGKSCAGAARPSGSCT